MLLSYSNYNGSLVVVIIVPTRTLHMLTYATLQNLDTLERSIARINYM